MITLLYLLKYARKCMTFSLSATTFFSARLFLHEPSSKNVDASSSVVVVVCFYTLAINGAASIRSDMLLLSSPRCDSSMVRWLGLRNIACDRIKIDEIPVQIMAGTIQAQTIAMVEMKNNR
jgi:hypothetical protein